jgi:hypothetical protein
MPKVDEVTAMDGGPGFMVRQDNNRLIASFVFASDAEARAAQQQMQEILANCVKATGFA